MKCKYGNAHERFFSVELSPRSIQMKGYCKKNSSRNSARLARHRTGNQNENASGRHSIPICLCLRSRTRSPRSAEVRVVITVFSVVGSLQLFRAFVWHLDGFNGGSGAFCLWTTLSIESNAPLIPFLTTPTVLDLNDRHAWIATIVRNGFGLEINAWIDWTGRGGTGWIGRWAAGRWRRRRRRRR